MPARHSFKPGVKFHLDLVALLALAGLAICTALTILRYYPDNRLSLLCHVGSNDGCNAAGQSAFGSLFGMPTAAFGIFFYLLVLISALVAQYSGGLISLFFGAIFLPLTALSLAVDILLAGVQFYLHVFCGLCTLTYAINALLLVIICRLYRDAGSAAGISRGGLWSAMMKWKDSSAESKAVVALYFLFVAFSALYAFSFPCILSFKSGGSALSSQDIRREVADFLGEKIEPLDLPASSLASGDPGARVKIIVFTDFSCSACVHFLSIEKRLMGRYPGGLEIVHYNYPVDASCNPHIQESSHPDSCVASRALIAAGGRSIFEGFLGRYIENYETGGHGGFNSATACALLPEGMAAAAFQQDMNSEITSQILKRDIELGWNLKIQATPTIFIDGRRMEGAPRWEILEAIIDEELSRSNHHN